jgi:hypothetical protein
VVNLKRLVNRAPGVNVDCWVGDGHIMQMREDAGLVLWVCKRPGCWYHYWAEPGDDVMAASREDLDNLEAGSAF